LSGELITLPPPPLETLEVHGRPVAARSALRFFVGVPQSNEVRSSDGNHVDPAFTDRWRPFSEREEEEEEYPITGNLDAFWLGNGRAGEVYCDSSSAETEDFLTSKFTVTGAAGWMLAGAGGLGRGLPADVHSDNNVGL